MTRKLLITRTEHDLGNRYLYAYSGQIIAQAEAKGWQVERAEKNQACRSSVVSRLKNRPDFVVFNGHGSKEEVFGHADETLVGVNDAGLFFGMVSFIRACSALDGLGREAVKKGAKAVIGYHGEFWIPRVFEFHATPLNDPSARPVLEASNAVPLKVVKGATVSQAVAASTEKTRGLVLKLLVSSEPYDAPALRALINNGSLLGFEGDANARA